MSTSNSMRPIAQQAIKEASATKFSISLFLLIVIAAGCYWAGRDSTRGVSEAQVKVLTSATDQRLAEVVKGLQALAELQKAASAESSREHQQMKDQLHKQTVEVEVMRSHVANRR